MKKLEKAQEVTNFIANQVANQLEGISSSKSSTPKKEKTTKKEAKAKAPAKKEEEANVVELPAAKKAKKEKATKKEVIKEVAKQQKVSIIEEVISNREVKYIYPEDVQDTLARKKWRQQVRNELRKLERELFRIQDTNSKEHKEASKKYEAFKAKVLKPDQAI